MQSPNPVEIRSKKSPEKLLLPHPTDLDLETFLSNDVAAEAELEPALSLLPSSTMGPFIALDVYCDCECDFESLLATALPEPEPEPEAAE